MTLVATGPLTNLAIALRKQPAIAEAAREVVIMGGSCSRGNVTPAAEFNIFVDPEAAAIVFGAQWKVTMMGLDLTHQATCTAPPSARSTGRDAGCPFVRRLLTFFRESCRSAAGMEDPRFTTPARWSTSPPPTFRDPGGRVELELHGTATAGMTVVDFTPSDGLGAVGGSFARPAAFWDTVIDAIVRVG